MGVEHLSFLVIVENLICLADGLEFDLGLRSLVCRDLVRMTRERSLSDKERISMVPSDSNDIVLGNAYLVICLLDLRFAGLFADAQHTYSMSG